MNDVLCPRKSLVRLKKLNSIVAGHRTASMTRLFKTFFLHILFLFFACLAFTGKCENFIEIFRDDFNSSEIDTAKWNVTDSNFSFPNQEGLYRSSAVTVKNGLLILRVSRRPNPNGAGCLYEAPRLTTTSQHKFLYGVIEWRTQMISEKGLETTLWLASSQYQYRWQGPYGSEPMNESSDSICFWSDNGQIAARLFHRPKDSVNEFYPVANKLYTKLNLSDSDRDDFHRFRIVWRRDSLEWFVDDKRILAVADASKIPHVPLYLIMNVLISPVFSESDKLNRFMQPFPEREALIDYVSVKQFTSVGDYNLAAVQAANQGTIHMGWTLGGLAGTLLMILLAAGGLFFYKFRQRDRTVLSEDREEAVMHSVFDRD